MHTLAAGLDTPESADGNEAPPPHAYTPETHKAVRTVPEPVRPVRAVKEPVRAGTERAVTVQNQSVQ